MGKIDKKTRKTIELLLRQWIQLRMAYGCLNTDTNFSYVDIDEETKKEHLIAMTKMIKYFQDLLDSNKISSETVEKLKAWEEGKFLYDEFN